EGRGDDDQRPPAVLEPERRDHAGEREEEDDRRDQRGEEDGDADVLGAGEPEPGQRIPRGDGGQEGDERHPGRDRHGVDDPGAVVRLVEEDLEVLERRRQVEPERDVVHPVEIGLLLERRDQHPVDGEDGDQDERGEARVDQQMTPELLLALGPRWRHGSHDPGHRLASPRGCGSHYHSRRFRFRRTRKSAGNSSGTRKSAIAAPRPRLPAWMPTWYASTGRILLALPGPPWVRRYTTLRSESVKTVSKRNPIIRIGKIIGTTTWRKRCMKVQPSTLAASRTSSGTAVKPARSTIALNGKVRHT